jgi:hypothetical protein
MARASTLGGDEMRLPKYVPAAVKPAVGRAGLLRLLGAGSGLFLGTFASTAAMAAVVGEDAVFSALCVEKAANGFTWKSGHWAPANLKTSKYVMERLNPDGDGCRIVIAAGTHHDYGTVTIATGCYSVHLAERDGEGIDGCREVWMIVANQLTLLNATCTIDELTVTFQPDGNFHMASYESDLAEKPESGTKGPMFVSYGKCEVR